MPDEVAAGLEAEARRRGMGVDTLLVELSSAVLAGGEGLEAFIGVGRSGRGDLGRRYRQIGAEVLGRRSARDL